MRAFPKKQALPLRKPLPRVIASVSVIDQMVERFFFQGFTDVEGDCYPNLPCKKGIGFSDEHAAMIGNRVRDLSHALGVPPVASDVRGWEKNFNLEMATCHANLMINCCEDIDRCGVALRRACDWWRFSLVTTPHVLDTGELLVFDDTRVQRSGDFLTTSSNSDGRGVAAEAVGSVPCTMGDDCLEWTNLSVDELKARYAAINLPVRDVEVHSPEDFLFCSHRFKRQADGGWKCWLETWQRMLYESSYSCLGDSSTQANYMSEISNMPDSNPDKERILRYLSERQMLLGAVTGHDKEEKDPDSGL